MVVHQFVLQEWGKSCPPFVAAYKLEHDMTFTPYDKITKREDDDAIIDKILKTNSNQLSLTFNWKGRHRLAGVCYQTVITSVNLTVSSFFTFSSQKRLLLHSQPRLSESLLLVLNLIYTRLTLRKTHFNVTDCWTFQSGPKTIVHFLKSSFLSTIFISDSSHQILHEPLEKINSFDVFSFSK